MKKQEHVRHYAFDFDYTLAESSMGTILCARHALEVLGFPCPDDTAIKRTIGLDLPTTFRTLTGVDDDELAEQFKYQFGIHADEVMLDCISFYDGVKTTLSNLKRDDMAVSIVSTKFGYRIEAALQRDGLDGLVDQVIGGDMVRNTKPNPEGLLRVMNAVGASADETIYVGDSTTDGECARRAGVAFLAVKTGEAEVDELIEFDPVAVLESVDQLSHWRLNAWR
ncbi:MAG: HAD-IA family hydrolase [Pseudomonadales bacterium]|nr:HAD-IA family hydrolase [Pseudomonadales bacterium]